MSAEGVRARFTQIDRGRRVETFWLCRSERARLGNQTHRRSAAEEAAKQEAVKNTDHPEAAEDRVVLD